MDFLRLDAGSEWSNNVEAFSLLRQGRRTRRSLACTAPGQHIFSYTRSRGLLRHTEGPGTRQLLDKFQKELVAYHDPEPRFTQAAFSTLAWEMISLHDDEIRYRSGFCAYDYLQIDPAMDSFRKSAEYATVLNDAKQCRDRFLAERDRPQP